jgi:chorismate mutase/prephenate dehydratase
MSLAEHRKAIDLLDQRIVALLNERTGHVLKIGEIKVKAGEEIYAPHRELAVLERVCKQNKGPITNESLRAIYREIMSSALSLEKTMVIAYFGPEATYTHQAAIRRFGASLNYVPMKTIGDVFTEVSKGRADYGVVPVENSTEGIVTHTLDMLVDSDLKVVAQIVLPIQHCLLSNSPRDKIKKLYSHPQPLGQCRAYLQLHLANVEVVETSSTTRAAQLAAGEAGAAALASSLAAEKYGIKILESDVQDNSNNATRFLVLGRQCSPPTGKDRTSLMISLAHEVGALHKALAPFEKFKINMTKIESRPNKRKAWEYFFFVDCDGHIDDPQLKKATAQLAKDVAYLKVLGSYPNAE